MPDAVRSNFSGPAVVGALQGICLGGPSGPRNSSLGRHLQSGVRRSDTEGTPSAPSLVIGQPGFWRFRWSVTSGLHTISISVKQPSNATPYPTMTIKANPDIGVAADVVGTSPGGAGWVTIGPINVTPTSAGVLWVELANNDTGTFDPTNGSFLPSAPCYWDNLSSA